MKIFIQFQLSKLGIGGEVSAKKGVVEAYVKDNTYITSKTVETSKVID